MLTDKTGAQVVVTEQPTERLYEISVADTRAGLTAYRDHRNPDAADGDPIERVFFHTEVAEEFGGRGLASILVAEAVAATRAAGLLIVGVCPLVAAFLDKHPEYDDIRRPATPGLQSWLETQL
ncbi:GNAT family N-acetyltransferase [Gordonia sp. ABSL1-1]|uniref:GNAT family N-acetyltransferase n=1 Tax=Gordonia sp. ABSL1-1 TaxID=3053923 RepID=UPI0025728E48|nr:GNAT family N-acetyltransferase [Gordonia sp. ABSL1-1]MDL9937925.1 GNAT family N-acetyltransferase [Gordonia sp. ABSL1-1]